MSWVEKEKKGGQVEREGRNSRNRDNKCKDMRGGSRCFVLQA